MEECEGAKQKRKRREGKWINRGTKGLETKRSREGGVNIGGLYRKEKLGKVGEAQGLEKFGVGQGTEKSQAL